ncbi:bifunctional aspartate kinase/homoserine dehydrogenase I [Limibacter armeniacum]|uniref:bifunctional aspartate kinase/homoserine dehydrogenase I n=1 Tax=Limibacter armeniacum TaxID=466084 RepID=UPI002FE62065
MIVLKFGGTSVGTVDSIRQVCKILQNNTAQGKRMAVVVSAMSGITNKLITAGQLSAGGDENYLHLLKEIEETHFTAIRELMGVQSQSRVFAQTKRLLNELEDLLRGISLLKEISLRAMDLLQSFGERLSSQIIAEFLKQEGLPAEALDARTLIQTNKSFGSAKVNFEVTNANIGTHFAGNDKLHIITGFVASTDDGQTTTLGRGGSDYTAAIFGAALNADCIEIWTDVDGVLTADPRVVPEAFTLEKLSYEEAMELSHFGAKVIYPPTLQPAFKKKIPLVIRNTFNPSFEGTFISEESGHDELPVKGISSIKDIALLTLKGSGMIGVSGVSARLFSTLAQEDISVILITQASSEHSITFAVAPEVAVKAKEAIDEAFSIEINAGKVDSIEIETGLSVVAIIGENMKHTPGIAANMFAAMGKNGVNIAAIAQGSSELNISTVIEQRHLAKTINALHEAFFLSDKVTLNVFVLGWGLIGGTLLRQIKEQQEYLAQEQGLNIKVIGVANSQKMLLDEKGINLELSKEDILSVGVPSNTPSYIARMKQMNLANSVFVDCTPGMDGVKEYASILDASISICTPNKLCNSGTYNDYKAIQDISARRKVKFMYETNVGAGLPVISPLNDLKHSGDKVYKIEGILSGTLSYIFNSFTLGKSFTDIVKNAKEKGFTEPDPRDDLSGMDVARKILILAREAGFKLEPEDVKVENILPEACLNAASVDEFFEQLQKHEHLFEKRMTEANEEGKVLRFVAALENGEARVVLKAVDESHPFYHLSGSDNMVVFTTKRYLNEPLVIKGPGAGAEVTAAGVFAEIITIGNYLTNA